ncbi:MAG: hypothetical protein QNJ27_04730 [Simkaniaceae bacterium]|nr:hypothetical protein [Simkaniaceae bacterium]
MTYQGRAFYNLLQMNLKNNPSLEVEEWQVEDYRALSEEKLFERLEQLEIFMDRKNLLLRVEQCDSPEDLADCLYLEEDYEKHEKVFLAIFELWRRLVPDKQSLSVFVDAFDHLIERYEEGDGDCEEDLQRALESVQAILDDNVDAGGEAHEGYHFFSAYSCHDLGIFIFEYIAHQIDVGDEQYANELLDGFYPYVDHKRWFDLLKARLVAATDMEEGKMMIYRLLGSLKEEPELYLLFETLHYLIYVEETELFRLTYHQVLEEIETKRDLKELLTLTVEYFNAIEMEKEEAVVTKLLEEHGGENLQKKISIPNQALKKLKELVSLSLGM